MKPSHQAEKAPRPILPQVVSSEGQNRRMQLARCEFAAARCPGAAARPSRRPVLTKKKPAAAVARAASRRDEAEFGGDGGRLVDEGMAELRRRIREVRAAERGWEMPAELEDEWHPAADGRVCSLIAALQALLLSARPGVVLVGLVAALVLAVPASAFAHVCRLVTLLSSLSR